MGRRPAADNLASDDRRTALGAIRDKLAAELRAAEGQNAATIARVLLDVGRELASLDAKKERSKTDELADRRKARRAAASDPKRAASGNDGSG